MRFDRLAIRLSKNASAALVLAAGAAIALSTDILRSRLREEALPLPAELRDLAEVREDASAAAGELVALRRLKRRDISAFKQGLATLTKSRRSIYEAGLALQEEKRLLDKQWEIMTTYLMVEELDRKIHLMRGEQALETYSFSMTPRYYPDNSRLPANESRIISKERFAHDQRGSYTEKDGQLRWEPPQVGLPSRADALGQYVMFTDGPLILHGPPANAAAHEAYPHVCLALSAATARKLYSESFIGTKILLRLDKGTP